MGNPNNEFLEKAAVLGLAVPTAAMVGSKVGQSVDKPNSYESEKQYRDSIRGKNYATPDIEDKLEEIRRSMKPSGGGGGESTARPKVMKKGGKVKKMSKGGSASSRADGIAQRGKTKGRFV